MHVYNEKSIHIQKGTNSQADEQKCDHRVTSFKEGFTSWAVLGLFVLVDIVGQLAGIVPFKKRS